ISRSRFLVRGIAELAMLDSKAAQIGAVSGGKLRRLIRDDSLRRTGKLRIQLLCDRTCDFTFDSEDIVHLAPLIVRPKMCVGARIDSLHLHADFVSRSFTEPSKMVPTPSCCPTI